MFKSVGLYQTAPNCLWKGVDGNMTGEFRRTGVHAAIGVLVAILIIAGVFAGGLQFPSLGPASRNRGILLVKLTDAPVDLKHLNVTIDGISAQKDEGGNETWQRLEFVANVSEVYVDILSLRNVTMDLSLTEIPAGNYTKLRLSIRTANATHIGGSTQELRVPPGHLDVKVHFEIKAGETTIILVDMQPNTNISESGNLRPVLKATLIQS